MLQDLATCPTEKLLYPHLYIPGCGNADITQWNTSHITDMSYMFQNYPGEIPDISNWDTSNVTNMERMFKNYKGKLPDMSRWNTEKVTNMSYMFYFCTGANEAKV